MKSYSAYAASIFGGIYGGERGSDSSNQNYFEHTYVGKTWMTDEQKFAFVAFRKNFCHGIVNFPCPVPTQILLPSVNVVFVDTFIASRHGVVVMIVYVCAASAVHIFTLNHCKSGIRCKRTNGSSLMQGAQTAAHSCKARFSIVLLMTRGDDNSSA